MTIFIVVTALFFLVLSLTPLFLAGARDDDKASIHLPE